MPLEVQHINCLRVAGTAGLGLAAGMALGVSSLTVPALGAALSPSERLRVWSRLYDRGKVQLPAGTLAAALALGAAALLTDPEADLGLLAIHRRALLGAAVVAAVSIIPFTFAVMMPGIRRLKEIEKQTLPDALAAGKESDATIARWNGQHAVRAGLLSVAFLFSAIERT